MAIMLATVNWQTLWPQIFVVCLVVGVMWAFVKEVRTPDIIAMTVFMIVLVMPGLLDFKEKREVMKVFSSSAPLIIASMFVISAALERVGLIKALGEVFERVTNGKEFRIYLFLFVIIAPLSAIVSNTPVVVIFMPIIVRICRKHNLESSRFLIPLSYATIIGGTATIIGTSTNVLASEIAANHKPGIDSPISMFETSKLAVILTLNVMIYIMLFGKKLLPKRQSLASLLDDGDGKEYISSAIIHAQSPLIGKMYKETALAKNRELRAVRINRGSRKIDRAKFDEVNLQQGDEIIFKTHISGVVEMSKSKELILKSHANMGLTHLSAQSSEIMEGILGLDSPMIGKRLQNVDFQRRHSVTILAVHRKGKNIMNKFSDIKLAFGDTLLMEGGKENMARLFEGRDFVNLSRPKERPLRRKKAPLAIGALAAFIIGGYFKILPLEVLALSCAFFTILTRCIDPGEAYNSIEWRVIFMILGMMGLGKTIEITGVAENFTRLFLDFLHTTDPRILVFAIFLLCGVLTEIINNQAVAVLTTPLVLSIADSIGVDPRPFVITVMIAASSSFSTPIGYQTNTYVYGAGGYKFKDFLRIGLPLSLINWILASILIPIFWKF